MSKLNKKYKLFLLLFRTRSVTPKRVGQDRTRSVRDLNFKPPDMKQESSSVGLQGGQNKPHFSTD